MMLPSDCQLSTTLPVVLRNRVRKKPAWIADRDKQCLLSSTESATPVALYSYARSSRVMLGVYLMDSKSVAPESLYNSERASTWKRTAGKK